MRAGAAAAGYSRGSSVLNHSHALGPDRRSSVGLRHAPVRGGGSGQFLTSFLENADIPCRGKGAEERPRRIALGRQFLAGHDLLEHGNVKFLRPRSSTITSFEEDAGSSAASPADDEDPITSIMAGGDGEKDDAESNAVAEKAQEDAVQEEEIEDANQPDAG